MNPRVYDLSMSAGLTLVCAGVYQLAGLPWTLIAAGAGIIGLTALGALLEGRG